MAYGTKGTTGKASTKKKKPSKKGYPKTKEVMAPRPQDKPDPKKKKKKNGTKKGPYKTKTMVA